MKKSGLIAVTIAALFGLLTGCVTLRPAVGFPQGPMVYEDGKLTAQVVCPSPYWAELTVKNTSGDVVTILWDVSSYTGSRGNSSRVAPEGTLYVDMQKTVPPIAVPPGSTFRRPFAAADSARYTSGQYGGWQTLPWIPSDLAGCSFVIGYRIGSGPDKFMVFHGADATREAAQFREQIVGTVRVKKAFVNPLFLRSIDKRRAVLYGLAVEQARKQHGPKAELVNVRYEGKWNVASLLLYFSILGFVETATIDADVRVAE